MNIKNINRVTEIAKQLPDLEMARSFLSGMEADVIINKNGESIILPRTINMNMLQIINCEINKLKKEVESL